MFNSAMAGSKDKLGSSYENLQWPPADYEHPDQQYSPPRGSYIQQQQSSNTYQQQQTANRNQQPQPAIMYQQQPTNMYQQHNPANIYQQQPTNIYQQQPTNMNQQQPTNIYQQQPTNMNQQQPANIYQQQPTNIYQQQPANMNQQQPTNIYQQQPTNMNQQQPTNIYQQQPANMNQQDQFPTVYQQQQQLSNVHQQQPMIFLQPVTLQPTSASSTNDVVVNEVAGPQVIRKRAWRTGLCSCLDDIGIGLIVCCLGSYASICCNCCGCFNIAAMIMSSQMQETCCVPCCVGNFLVTMRTKVRTQLGIEGSVFCDQCVISWCGMCAQCQMWREYKLARESGEII